MLLYFYQNSFSYVAWYQLKLCSLFFPEQDDRIRTPWILPWQPLLGLDTQLRKQTQKRVLRVVPAAEERGYINPRTCLWVTTLLFEEIFNELWDFRLEGLHHDEMLRGAVTVQRHRIWSGLTGNSSLLF